MKALMVAGAALSFCALSVSAVSVQEDLVFDLGGINPTTDGTPAVRADIVNLREWDEPRRAGVFGLVSVLVPFIGDACAGLWRQ